MYVQSPSYAEGITSLSFWLRGRSDVTGNTLTVSGFDGRRWHRISELEIPREARTVELDPDLLEGMLSVRIAYTKKTSAGNAVIDDLCIGTGVPLERIYHPGYERRDVGAGGEVKVGGLSANTVYYATVAAVNGALTSLTSPETRFTTSGDASIAEIIGGDSASLQLEGETLKVKCRPGSAVSLCNVAGMTLRTVEAGSDGTALFRLPSIGVYIVRLPEITFKILK